MKKLLLLMLCLVLLCGCTQDAPVETTTAPPATTPAPADMGLYIPGADKTGIRAYRMDEPVIYLGQLNSELLVATATGEDQTRLRILSGNNCVVRCEKLLEKGCTVTGGFRATGSGISYYNGAEHTLVILDLNLQECTRMSLPSDMVGTPVVAGDMRTVYYCTDSEIRALSLETGISRLLKQQNCQWQNLESLANHDQLLLCNMEMDGQNQVCFIATQDGRTMGSDANQTVFRGMGDVFFLRRTDGLVEENLFGDFSGGMKAFALDSEGKIFNYVDGTDCLTVSSLTQTGILLEAYSLTDGRMYSALELEGISHVDGIVGDGDVLWIATWSPDQQTLCRWDTAATAQKGTQSYLTPRYTAQNPDESGLALCRQKAQALSQQYGVRIVLDAGSLQQPEDYSLTAEFQVAPIADGLAQLEAAMARFPEEFFRRIVEDTSCKVLEISLVRDVEGEQDALQYWRGADAFIALEVGEKLEQNFYHEVCHVLDNFLLANTRDLDVWNKLNPKGFQYDHSFDVYKTHGQEYLEGKSRAFIDAYSRTYPREDRARILEYAMLPERGSYFESKTMQEKLHLLCFSIRDAFNWKKDARVFPWEQYLEEPLAYVKKK